MRRDERKEVKKRKIRMHVCCAEVPLTPQKSHDRDFRSATLKAAANQGVNLKQSRQVRKKQGPYGPLSTVITRHLV